jgi:hypothetical protein
MEWIVSSPRGTAMGRPPKAGIDVLGEIDQLRADRNRVSHDFDRLRDQLDQLQAHLQRSEAIKNWHLWQEAGHSSKAARRFLAD